MSKSFFILTLCLALCGPSALSEEPPPGSEAFHDCDSPGSPAYHPSGTGGENEHFNCELDQGVDPSMSECHQTWKGFGWDTIRTYNDSGTNGISYCPPEAGGKGYVSCTANDAGGQKGVAKAGPTVVSCKHGNSGSYFTCSCEVYSVSGCSRSFNM